MSSCLHPRVIYNNKAGHAYLVPCGRCSACMRRKKNTWIHRIEQERLHGNYKNAFFVTLSYDDSHLSYESFSRIVKGQRIKEVEPTGEALLNPYDLAMFFKRFRVFSGEKISYFAVGEYGDPSYTERPHFHIILFTNLDWSETLKFTRLAWSRLRPETPQERYLRYKKSRELGFLIKRDASDMHNRESFGRDQVRSVNSKRICYVAKYVQKLWQDKTVPPFYRASNGLGICFVFSDTAYKLSQYNRHYTYFSNGLPVALSRYYSSRIFNTYQMDRFNLEMANQTACPYPPDDYEACREWYEYQARETQLKAIQSNFNFYGVHKYT